MENLLLSPPLVTNFYECTQREIGDGRGWVVSIGDVKNYWYFSLFVIFLYLRTLCALLIKDGVMSRVVTYAYILCKCVDFKDFGYDW